MPKPLPLTDITRRMRDLGFQFLKGPPGFLVYTRTLEPYFPYATQRTKAYHFPAAYEELDVLPVEIIEDIILHTFLSSDEEEAFWKNEPPVN